MPDADARSGDDARVFALFDGGDSLDIETIVHSSGHALGEVALALGRLEDAGFLERNGAWWQRDMTLARTE